MCGHNARRLLQSLCRSSVRTYPGSFCRWGFPVGPAHALSPKRCRPAGGDRWVCRSRPLLLPASGILCRIPKLRLPPESFLSYYNILL